MSGFLSYKNQQTLASFDDKHNVVIGRNGSGKSNFFKAIRFILNDAYSNMSRQDRQALLHEGSEHTLAAYVQIVFDNKDNRFPTGKDKVVLRRTIGLKKDEYSLDKKSVSKTDVANLLESAGFSKANPYYIVPQGRITALTNAKDHERLQVLRDVAGTSVYELRRIDSLKLMEETEQKHFKITELMDFITERMDELEGEKKELRQYQLQDRERRCLQYAIFSKEQEETDLLLEDLHENYQNSNEGASDRHNTFFEREKKITEIENQILKYTRTKDTLSKERALLILDKDEETRSKQHLELMLGDLNESKETRESETERLNADLERVESLIKKKRQGLNIMVPELESCESEEKSLQSKLEELKLEQSRLYAKQNRQTQFQTKQSRDNFLTTQIKNLESSIKDQTEQVEQMKSSLANGKLDLQRIAGGIKRVKAKFEQRKEGLEELANEERSLRMDRSTFDEERKSLWRKEAQASQALAGLKDQQQSAKRAFESTLDRSTNAGLQAVTRIAHRLGLTDRVHGCIYELFECDEKYQTAVEVVAGGSLFHVVVDTDDTATKILDVLNREKGGRVTFMPLNRLKQRELSNNLVDSGVIPMIKILRFDPVVRKAFLQVFGKAVICSSLEVADKSARTHGLTAVTMDGDRVGRKGEITGGYNDRQRSRLQAIKTLKQLTSEILSKTTIFETLKTEIETLDQSLTELKNNQTKNEQKKRKLTDSNAQLQGDQNALLRDEIRATEACAQKARGLEGLEKGVRESVMQIEGFRKEILEPFKKSLDGGERDRVEAVGREVREGSEALNLVIGKRVELRERKEILEVELRENLEKRKLDIESELEKLGLRIDSQEISSRRGEYAGMNKRLDEFGRRISEIDIEIEEIDETIMKESSVLENSRNEQQEDQTNIQQHSRVLEKFISRKAGLVKKKEETDMSIRELGLIPDEAFEKYRSMPNKKLLSKLHQVNEGLKKFKSVNKQAVEQYNNFTIQKVSLEKREQELEESKIAIENLIKSLDQRKNEAIKKTFKQVAKNFSEVWEKLVPAGNGRLIIMRKDGKTETGSDTAEEDSDDNSDLEEEDDTQQSTNNNNNGEKDKYAGVSITVSFNHKEDEGLRMGQLSGGQKSLVALALIFAIQRCDPAPFYLFDEIDAALDAQYRTAVASMIHELSETAQFITTTFRPEMLTHADKFYGVTFNNKVSKIQVITRDNARDFIEQEQPH